MTDICVEFGQVCMAWLNDGVSWYVSLYIYANMDTNLQRVADKSLWISSWICVIFTDKKCIDLRHLVFAVPNVLQAISTLTISFVRVADLYSV